MAKTMKCDKCGGDFLSQNFKRHYNKCNGSGEYKWYETLKECPKCNIDLTNIENVGGHIRWCGHVKVKKVYEKKEKRKLTEETKRQMSIKKIQFLAEHPEKHNWKRNDKLKSIPCESFKDILRNSGFNFVEEYTPLKDRHYSIDIAFLDDKVGIEINGNQHYDKERNLKPYYKQRHDNIVNDGWKLIEIPFLMVYNEEFVAEFIMRLRDMNLQNTIYPNIIRAKIERHKDCKCGKKILIGSKMCVECTREEMKNNDIPPNDILFRHVRVMGYVRAAKAYNVCDNTIRKWIIKNGGTPPKQEEYGLNREINDPNQLSFDF